jgi:signal transduction histidine kinase
MPYSASTSATRFSLLHVLWAVGAIWVLILFLAAIPVAFVQLQVTCDGAACLGAQLSTTQARDIARLGLSLPGYATYILALNGIFFAVFFATALLIMWRRPTDRSAQITAIFLVLFGGATFPGTLDALAGVHPIWRGVIASARLVGVAAIAWFAATFPSGRFVPRWLWGFIPLWVLAQAPDAFLPTSPLGFRQLPRLVVFVVFAGGLGGLLAGQIYRYWRVSSTIERQQTKWVVVGMTTSIVGFVALILVAALVPADARSNGIGTLLVVSGYYVCLLLIPISIGVALLRYRLWEADVFINRLLVYGALTACVVGIYVLVVGYLGAVFRTTSNLVISLVATGLVAMVFQPLRTWLQRRVNRLVYGLRDEPYTLLSRLSQRIALTVDQDNVLSAIVETVAQALKLPYVAVILQRDGASITVASQGTRVPNTLTLPLSYQAAPIGAFLLAPRAPGEAFSPAEHQLLEELARQVGLAAHAVTLTDDLRLANAHLQMTRQQLVAAREEERRRLRRDLHDGLGPTLGHLMFQLDAAHRLAPVDPTAAQALIVQLKAHTQAAVADIRRLVYALRPPALDDLGLVSALAEQAAQYSQTTPVQVQLDAPLTLPSLPAAIEVATYRIALEALTNVVRHAHATKCCVRLTLSEDVQVEILDNGRGMPDDFRAGVGITAMRERAEELGGACVIARDKEWGGVRVIATLPVPKEG